MLKVAKVVGLNSDTDAALVFISRPNTVELEGEETTLRLYLIVAATLDDAFSQTRQAISEAENTFYSFSQDPKVLLEEVVQVVKSSLEGAQKIGVIVGLSKEQSSQQVLYLQYFGPDVMAYLLRDGEKIDLCQMSSHLHLVSGKLKGRDRVVLAVGEMEESLEKDFKRLDNIDIEEWEEEVGARLPQMQVYQLASIVIENEVEVSEEIAGVESLNEYTQFSDKRGKFSNSASYIISFIKNFKKVFISSKKGIVLTGIIFLMLILSVMGWNLKHQKNLKIESDFSHKLSKATEEYQKAIGFKDSDPLASSQSLTSAEDFLKQALQARPQDSKALDLKKQLEENSGTILKAFEVKELNLWLDLNLVKKDFQAQQISLSSEKLLVLDSQKDVLVRIDLSTKAPQLLAGSDKLGDAQISSLNGAIAWVKSQDQGLINIDTGSNKIATVIKVDPEWGDIVDINGFAGNIYLLDKGNQLSGGQIWKYLPIENGYSDKRSYFKEGAQYSLGSARKLQIDGSIWVLGTDGKILKFTQGSADYFSFTGVRDEVKDASSFFLSDQTANLYLLDRGNKRLLVTDKQGVYKSQYFGDKFSSIDDLIVDEKNKKVYLLGDNKIYLLELK